MLQFSGTGVGAPLQHLASGGLRSSQLILLQLFCSLRFYSFMGCSAALFPHDWWDMPLGFAGLFLIVWGHCCGDHVFSCSHTTLCRQRDIICILIQGCLP